MELRLGVYRDERTPPKAVGGCTSRKSLLRGGAALGCALVGALLLAGCEKAGPRAPEPMAEATNPPPEPPSLHLDHAQSNLPVIHLWVGPEELNTEVCLSAQQLATGMMFRTNLAENAAMLFAFGIPHRASFYMKNTTVPLSAAYINPEGVILEIHDLKPLDETSVEAKSDQVQYVLEVKQGWFGRHGVSTGAVVRTSQGTLREVFGAGQPP